MAHIGQGAGDYVAGRLDLEAMARAAEHLGVCAQCRLLVAREKQRAHRLEAGSGPVPPADLNARILAATRGLSTDGCESLALRSARRRPGRLLVTTASFGALALVLGTIAYVAGGETGPVRPAVAGSTPAPVTAETSGNAIVSSWPRDAAMPAAGTELAAAVATTELAELQKSGWERPELEQLGYPLTGAEGFVLGKVPTLKLTFSNGSTSLTVYEQRQGDTAAGTPVNVLTGHPVAEDGFEAMEMQPAGYQTPSGPDTALWLHRGMPWQLVFGWDGASYTVTSTVPADRLQQICRTLMAMPSPAVNPPAPASAVPSAPPVPGGLLDRMLRGVSRLVNGG